MFSIQDKSVDKIFSSIVHHAINGGASNIHIELLDDKVVVRYRVRGVLSNVFTIPSHFYRSLIQHIKSSAGIFAAKTIGIQYGIIRTTVDNSTVGLSISVIPLLDNNEKIVIGVNYDCCNEGGLVFTPQDRNNIVNIVGGNGIILMIGVDNSNVFGYFYSFLNTLNDVGCDVVSIEDSVNIDVNGVNQIELNDNIGLDFISALNISSNTGPDIICINSVLSRSGLGCVMDKSSDSLILLTIPSRSLDDVILRVRNIGIDPVLLFSRLRLLVNCDTKSELTTRFK